MESLIRPCTVFVVSLDVDIPFLIGQATNKNSMLYPKICSMFDHFIFLLIENLSKKETLFVRLYIPLPPRLQIMEHSVALFPQIKGL